MPLPPLGFGGTIAQAVNRVRKLPVYVETPTHAEKSGRPNQPRAASRMMRRSAEPITIRVRSAASGFTETDVIP